MRLKSLLTLAAAAAVVAGAAAWAGHGIRAADERLAAALSSYEKGNEPDRAEARRLAALEPLCHQKAVDAAPDPARMKDPSADLAPEEIAGYSSRYSACLADDFLASKRPALEQARLYYSAVLPHLIYQASVAPSDASLTPLLDQVDAQRDRAFERDLARAKAFRPVADAVCVGFWGQRACHAAAGGRGAAAFRQRYVLMLIQRREAQESAHWKARNPAEASDYERRFNAAVAAKEPTPRPPWADALDALEARLLPLAMSEAPSSSPVAPAAAR